MQKTTFIFLLVLSLSTSLCAQEQKTVETTVNSPETLKQVFDEINAVKAGTFIITLTQDVLIEGINISSGGAQKSVTIKGDSKQRKITNSSDKNALFTVPSSVTLILGNNIILDGNSKHNFVVEVDKGGKLEMQNGSTVRNSAIDGVFVAGGSFAMMGGTISGNNRGVTFNDGKLNISGGTIRGNTDVGVYFFKGNFTMSGGTISGNTGGGVTISDAEFRMTNGTISGNFAESSGGGVFVGSDERRGAFFMSGGTISNNTAQYGGGVCLFDSTFTMTGGTIHGNTAEYDGGGLYLSNGGIFTKTGGTLDGSNRARTGRVAYVVADGVFRRNSAAGPSVNMDSNKSGFAGGWE